MSLISRTNRLGTMFLDHLTMTGIIFIISAPAMIYDFYQDFAGNGTSEKIFMGNPYLATFAFSLYFNKDIYQGRSLAKRISKLQVLNFKTNKPAGALRCFVRNLTIILWPVEIIAALLNTERRIGDRIAGTKLAIYDSTLDKNNINWLAIILALIISIVFIYLIAIVPLQFLFNNLRVSSEYH